MTRGRRKCIGHKAVLRPGTPGPAAEPPHHLVGVTQVLYDAAGYAEREVFSIEEAFPEAGEQRTLWINVDGVHDFTVLERVGRRFGLHPLLLADIAHNEQRPKLESCGKHHCLVLERLGDRMNEVMKVLTVIATIFIPLYLHRRSLRHELRAHDGVAPALRLRAGLGGHARRRRWDASLLPQEALVLAGGSGALT